MWAKVVCLKQYFQKRNYKYEIFNHLYFGPNFVFWGTALGRFSQCVFFKFFVVGQPRCSILKWPWNGKRQNKLIEKELLSKASNKFFTTDEFNHSIRELANKKYALYMQLKIWSFIYHQELYNLLSNLKTNPIIIRISESRLQKSKQPINNISLLNYIYQHTRTE